MHFAFHSDMFSLKPSAMQYRVSRFLVLTYGYGFRIGKSGHYLTPTVCTYRGTTNIIPVVLLSLVAFGDEGSNFLVASLPLRTLYLLRVMFIVTLHTNVETGGTEQFIQRTLSIMNM